MRILIMFVGMWMGVLGSVFTPDQATAEIIHDAEYSILEAQNGERWAKDDKAVVEKLAALRKKNGGKPPNIVYILLDDVGFGEIGMPDFSVVRGYNTPNIKSNCQ